MLVLNNITCKPCTDFQIQIAQLELKPGQIVSVVGQNGSGKSTFLKMLAGDYSYHGNIQLHQRCLTKYSGLERAQHMAMMTQSYALNFAFKASEVVTLGASNLRLHAAQKQQATHEMMQRLDCDLLKEKHYFSLSGGQQQRVQLARSLLQLAQAPRYPLLLVDEPISAQDLKYQHLVLQRLQDYALKHHYLIIAVLHDLNHALHYSRSCLLFHRGKLVQHGPTKDVLTACHIEKYWGYKPKQFNSDTTHLFF